MSPAQLYKNQKRLTEGPIGRALLALAWPVMLSNLFQTIHNLIDTFWLGRLGKVAVAAPTIAWPLIFLVISIGFGLTVAGTALVAQYTGAGRREEANHAAGQVVAFMAILAGLAAVIGVLVARPLLSLMGAGPDLLEQAVSYLQIIYAGIPTLFSMFVISALLNGVGDTVTPMKMMGAAVAINIVLSPLLIFGWGPFPAWEVAGAAVATVISRGLLSVVGLYLIFSGRLGIHIRLRHLRLRWETVKKIVAIGAPASLGITGTAVGFSVMTGILARFGTAAVSAFGIGSRIVSLALMPAMGLGHATAAMVGQNLGAEKPERAERAAWLGMGASTAILLVASVFVFFFRGSLIRAFIADPEVIALGEHMFALTAIAFPFMGMMQVIIGTYQGSGHTVYSMFFELFRLWVLRIPLVYFLGFTLGWQATGIWWAMIISNFGTAALALGFFLSGNWKRRVIKKAQPTVRPAAQPTTRSTAESTVGATAAPTAEAPIILHK